MRETLSKPLHWFFLLLAAVASVRLIRAGLADSMDFNVYWHAAQRFVQEGSSPYLFGRADRGFVFKYPPWIFPIFTPFGFMSENAARLVWSFVELFCVAFSVWRLHRWGVKLKAALISLASFWWIWLAHFYAGQFTLVLLAMAMFAIPDSGKPMGPLRNSWLAVVFSAKIFSLISLLGLIKNLLNRRTILAFLLLIFALHAILFVGFLFHGNPIGLLALYREWAQAATSGGHELGAIVIRGQMNHGFTAGLLRGFGVSPTDDWIDPWVALSLGAFFSLLWWKASNGLDLMERWAGWLGVGLIVHPLAWHHSFVLAYPLCTLALDRAWDTRKTQVIALAVLGICSIGILIPNVIGPDLVRPLELVSIKSWGVCFSAIALIWAKQQASHLRLHQTAEAASGLA